MYGKYVWILQIIPLNYLCFGVNLEKKPIKQNSLKIKAKRE